MREATRTLSHRDTHTHAVRSYAIEKRHDFQSGKAFVVFAVILAAAAAAAVAAEKVAAAAAAA